ncbi:hypothetical protein AAG906_014282 [Vitis piasezkii]
MRNRNPWNMIRIDKLLKHLDDLASTISDEHSQRRWYLLFLVRTSAQLLAHRIGSSVHGAVLKYGFEHDSYVQCGSIYMYAGLSGLAACYWMFSSNCEPDLVCQTTMVSACAKMGDLAFARKLFDKTPYKDPIAWNISIQLRGFTSYNAKAFPLIYIIGCANFLMKTGSLHSWDPHAMTFQMFLEKSRKILSSLATFRILQQPIYSLPDLISMIAQTKVSLDRITSFLRLDDLQSDVIETLPKGSFDTAIEIVDGNFSWDLSSHNPTLKDINLRVCRGMRVAVCGTVGSEVPKISGGTKAYVAQSPWIQSGKIAENILFGKEMDRERYERVLDACYLKKDLEVLSFGDQTVIGTRLFKECLLGLLGSKTVIYVRHQVEFLPAADLILVIKMEATLVLVTMRMVISVMIRVLKVTIHVSNAQKAHASLVETDDGDSKQEERGNSGDVCWSSDFWESYRKELLSSKTSLNVRRRENNDADTSGQILFAARTRMKYGSGAKLRFWSILEVAEKLCGSLPIYHPERRHSTAKSSHIIPKIQLSNYFEGHLSKASTDKGFQWSREDTLVTSSAQLKKSPIQFSYNSESDAHRNTFSSSSMKFELSSFDEATLSIDDSVDQIAKELLDQKSIMKQALHFRIEGLGIILHKIQNTVTNINEKEVVVIQSSSSTSNSDLGSSSSDSDPGTSSDSESEGASTILNWRLCVTLFNQKGFLYSQDTEDDWFGTEKKMIIIHQLHPILETFIIRLWVEAGHPGFETYYRIDLVMKNEVLHSLAWLIAINTATIAYFQPYVHPHREVTNHADYLRVPHQMGVPNQLLANSGSALTHQQIRDNASGANGEDDTPFNNQNCLVPKDLLISDDTIPETVQAEPVVVAAAVTSGAGSKDCILESERRTRHDNLHEAGAMVQPVDISIIYVRELPEIKGKFDHQRAGDQLENGEYGNLRFVHSDPTAHSDFGKGVREEFWNIIFFLYNKERMNVQVETDFVKMKATVVNFNVIGNGNLCSDGDYKNAAFILGDRKFALSIARGIESSMWTLHFRSCVFHSMAKLDFRLKNDFIFLFKK